MGVSDSNYDPHYTGELSFLLFDLVQQVKLFQCGASYSPKLYDPLCKIQKTKKMRKKGPHQSVH